MNHQKVTIAEVLTNPELLEPFIAAQESFILVSASKATGGFVTKRDDAWAIALEGFHKAIQKYDGNRGDFFVFAERVIRNSLVDQYRADKQHRTVILAESIPDNVAAPMENRDVLMEIQDLRLALNGYGILFKDLAECSPKAEKTKLACRLAVQGLMKNKGWMAEMKSTKKLPLAKIQEGTSVPRKILERHRKYIIAVAEILDGDYVYLAEYVKPFKEVE